MKVTQKINTKTVTNFNDSKNVTGKIYRSKQNFLLCETAPCNRDWNGRFFYTDESGKRDAFLIRWKESVFTGVTPQGTSKLEMDLCLNGDCKRLVYPSDGSAPAPSTIDRYVLSWTKRREGPGILIANMQEELLSGSLLAAFFYFACALSWPQAARMSLPMLFLTTATCPLLSSRFRKA